MVHIFIRYIKQTEHCGLHLFLSPLRLQLCQYFSQNKCESTSFWGVDFINPCRYFNEFNHQPV